MILLLGIVSGLPVLALALRDLAWGLPRWHRPVERLRCGVPGCRASFPLGPHAARTLELHERAAHQADDAPILWTRPIPVRCLDIVHRRRPGAVRGLPALVGGYAVSVNARR